MSEPNQETEAHLRMIVEHHKAVGAVMVDPRTVLDLFKERDRIREAAAETVTQAWHDGDGYSMKVDGDTFGHLAAALETDQ